MNNISSLKSNERITRSSSHSQNNSLVYKRKFETAPQQNSCSKLSGESPLENTNGLKIKQIEENLNSEEIQTNLVENVRKWVLLERELKHANENIRNIRENKHVVTKEICNWMKNREMPNRTIMVSDGELRFYDKREYSPLTFGYVENCLTKIIQDKQHVEFIMKYLKENREISITTDIRHVIHPENR
jgi:hypothetical protein